MGWAEKWKYQTSENSDFVIPDHPNRNKSWEEDLKLVCKYCTSTFQTHGMTWHSVAQQNIKRTNQADILCCLPIPPEPVVTKDRKASQD